ncbi:hypothetical protein BC834DRAFT_493488 [Gloeopeniophorella convolvens]|nr:hypothetical protein BC834DRAFT_493488 [Gloeopeniophorella convolvens]
MMPVILHDCPYRTPLSTLTWTFALVVLRLAADAMKFISGIFSSTLTAMITARRRFDKLANSLRVLAARGMLKSAEETAMKQPPGIDSRALAWTYDSLDEDHELEQFLAGVPGILNSEAMKQPELVLANVDIFRHRGHLINETLALMRRSARLSHSAEAAQRRRFEVCSNAAFAILPICPRFSKGQYWNTTDAKFATLLRLLERITKLPDHDVAFSAECMAFLVSQWTIIPNAILSSQVLSRTIHFPGLSPSGPLNHANVNNELTLHFIRRIALPYLDEPSNKARAKVVTTTLRHLSTEDLFSHDLCDIWNRVVQMPSDEDKDRVAVYILACLAPFYSACHLQSSWLTSARLNDVEDYDELIKCERSTFPSCTEDGHRLRPTYLLRTPIHSRGSQSAGERQIVTSPEPTAQSPPASEFPYRFSGGNHARDHVPDKRSGPRDCAGFPGTSKVRCLISTLTSSPPADLLVLSTESSSQSHQPATLVAVPTRPAVVPLPVGPADAGGSPQSAGAAPAASSAFGPDSLSNDDCLQGRGGVTAALQ